MQNKVWARPEVEELNVVMTQKSSSGKPSSKPSGKGDGCKDWSKS